MSRTVFPFHSDDISALARSLKGQIAACDHQPSHVELLNMLARAGGYRNFQHYRAQLAARDQLESRQPMSASESVDFVRVRSVLRVFDSDGRLVRWPSRRSRQELCLWALWSRLPAQEVMTESEINERLKADHLFGDHTMLRRWLCDYGMVSRTRDGREYRRVEQQPPPEALELIRRLQSALPD